MSLSPSFFLALSLKLQIFSLYVCSPFRYNSYFLPNIEVTTKDGTVVTTIIIFLFAITSTTANIIIMAYVSFLLFCFSI